MHKLKEKQIPFLNYEKKRIKFTSNDTRKYKGPSLHLLFGFLSSISFQSTKDEVTIKYSIRRGSKQLQLYEVRICFIKVTAVMNYTLSKKN